MGIQINGQTDTVTSTTAGGSVKVTPLAASTGLNVGTGASVSSPATNVLTLGTNNSERVRIDSSGNLGIGTISPQSKIDVRGDISVSGGLVNYLRGDTTYPKISINGSSANDTTGDVIISGYYPIIFKTDMGSERMRISRDGYVGINSASPRGTLDVGGGIAVGRVDSSSEGGEITFCKSLDNSSAWSVDVYGSTSTPSLRFIDNTASAARMSIDGSGRVTAPYQPCFLAGRSGTQTYSQGNTIVFNLEIFDQSNSYNNSTGVFTAPVTGRYLFLVTVLVQSSATGYEYDLLLSTSNRDYLGCPGRTEYQLGTSWGDGYIAHGVQQIADMDAGDTCSLRYTTFGGGSIYGGGGSGSWDGWTRFSGHLLC